MNECHWKKNYKETKSTQYDNEWIEDFWMQILDITAYDMCFVVWITVNLTD